MPEAPAVPLAGQIREVGREIGLRSAVYPRHVAHGRLTQEAADRQLAAMRAAYATLKALAAERAATPAAFRDLLLGIARTARR